jgi:hypothetical protein
LLRKHLFKLSSLLNAEAPSAEGEGASGSERTTSASIPIVAKVI